MSVRSLVERQPNSTRHNVGSIPTGRAKQKTPRLRWGSSECFGRAITLNAHGHISALADGDHMNSVTTAQGVIPRQAEHGTGGILWTGYARSARREPARGVM